MPNPIKIILLSLGLWLAVTAGVSAQETAVISPEITQAINLDENIQAVDLGVKEPRLLPGSTFYFLKNWSRGLKSVFTFNKVAEAELKLKFANEKLIEAKKLAETKPEVLVKALENYRAETDKLEKAVEKIKTTAKNNAKVDSFMDKLVDNTIKQQKLFGKFEKELPPEVYVEIEKAKEESIAKLSGIGLKLGSAENLQERITKATEVQPGSGFKQFKNLEVLQAVEEKVPEQAKPAIQQAMENSLQRLKDGLEEMPPQDRERFKDYVENIGGNETRHLRIVDELSRKEMPEPVREEIDKAREKTLERVEERVKEYEEKQLSQAQEEYFGHLTDYGRLEDLRVVKEMENNFSPEMVSSILEVKQRVEKKVIEVIEGIQTPEQERPLLEKIENKFHDTQQFEVLKEIEELVPPEKKDLYIKLKEKAVEKMAEEVARAEKARPEEKAMILEKLAGNSPEHIKILEELKPSSEITQKTIERIAEKTELIEGPAKLETLRKKLEENEIRIKIETVKPGVIERLEQKSEAVIKSITLERAQVEIRNVKNKIEEMGRVFDMLLRELQAELEKTNYRALVETAKQHLAKAEQAFQERNFGEAFGQATAAMQNLSNAEAARLKVIEQQGRVEERQEKWMSFIREVKERFPELIPGQVDSKTVLAVKLLLGCAIPAIPSADACEGKWSLPTDANGCPYFSCGAAGTSTEKPVEPLPVKPVESISVAECNFGQERYYDCPYDRRILWCKCQDGKWDCLDSPESACPVPKEIRYYECPDGTKVVSGTCEERGCVMKVSPELQCPAPTPPVTAGSECATLRETKYYTCSDGSPVAWCLCGPEGSSAGAKNRWKCQHLPELYCPKQTTTLTPTPTPAPTPAAPTKTGPEKYPSGNCTVGEAINYTCSDGTSIKWCVCDDIGWDCGLLYKEALGLCPGLSESYVESVDRKSSAEEGTCQPLSEVRIYRCPDGSLYKGCICTTGGYWSCPLESGRACPQTGPPVINRPTISGAVTSDLPVVERQTTPFGTIRITWTTNEPVTSRVEYGPTTSYGLTAGPDYFGSTYQGVTLSDLEENITYHFRIRARDKDSTPNTTVTEDYTLIMRRLPELLIQPISVDHFNADTPNKIHVNVLNEGVAAALKGFVVKIYVDDGFVGEITYDADLAAGASSDKALDYTFSSARGVVTIKAVVDATNLVTELNENNNETQHSISIYGSSAGSASPASPTSPEKRP